MEEILAETVTRLEWILIILATIIVLGPFIAERLRLPGMIGLVLGGLVLGPYGLGLLPEGSLDGIGGIGLLFLMFMAGVELDLNLFQRYRSAAIAFGLATFILPFLFSLVAAFSLGLGVLAAILMGSVWASHTLVAYPTVRHAGLAGNKAVATGVGATVITDTLALLVLAVVSGMAGGHESSAGAPPLITVVKLLVGLFLLYAYCMLFLPRFARWFFVSLGQDQILRFVFIIGALSSAGLLAVVVGMEGIVGAFFAGLGLNRMVPNGGRLMEHVEFFSSSLFVPAFLISVGMLINPVVLFNLETIVIAVVFFVALVLGKFLAAAWAGRRYHFSRAEVGVMFSLTIAQAAATLASTLVGYGLGLFGEQIVNAVLLVVLVSLILTSVGTRLYSSKVEPEAMLLKPLGTTVTVPVAPSPYLDKLMGMAANLAYPDAGILLPVVVVPEHESQEARPVYEKLLHTAEENGAAAGADVKGVLRFDSSEHLGVVREINEHLGSFLLVEWTSKPGLSDSMFGDRVDRLGVYSPVPAAAVRFTTETPQRLILAPGLDMGSTGYMVDLQAAVEIVSRLVQSTNLPLQVALPGDQLPEGVNLPEKAQVIPVEPGIGGVQALLQPGDILIVPAAIMRRAITSAVVQLSEAVKNVTLVVAAGPYRLNLTSAEVAKEAESIISFGKTA